MGLSAAEPLKFYWNNINEKNQVDSELWAKNLPDNGNKGCVAFEDLNSYKLNNFNCYSLSNFLCEYTKTSKEVACKKNWETYGDVCFNYFGSESQTWYGAKKYCEAQNSTLMTLKYQEKFNTVQAFFRTKAQSSSMSTRAWVHFKFKFFLIFNLL